MRASDGTRGREQASEPSMGAGDGGTIGTSSCSTPPPQTARAPLFWDGGAGAAWDNLKKDSGQSPGALILHVGSCTMPTSVALVHVFHQSAGC
jgi:hypothetical protein